MNLTFIHKHPVFALCLGITVLMLIVTVAGLFISSRLYSRQALALDTVTTQLQQLCRLDPFPVAANVHKEAENLKDIIDQYNELNEFMRAGQIDLQPMKAVDFMHFREKSLRKLRSSLQSARIKFPVKYAFGFDKYEGGQMPASGDVPGLVQQLNIIEVLCEILKEAGITELVAIKRENIELLRPPVASRRHGRAPSPEAAGNAPGGNKLVYSQHFEISFQARENAVIKILNLLASQPMFMVVTRVEMTNPRQEYSVGGSIRTPAAAPPPGVSEPSTRERHVILGREELDVKLDLDICQFAPSIPFREDGKK